MNQTDDSRQPSGGSVQTPVIICVAPNGARRTRTDHPAIPMTAEELGREAAACVDAGASVIHLHVRTDDGSHSLDIGRYRSAIRRIEESTQGKMLVQITTESVGIYKPEEQMAVVQALRPHAASVAIRELAPEPKHLPDALRFFSWSAAHGVALQFIVYTPEEAGLLAEMARRGELGCDFPNALFVLGRYTVGQQSSPIDLVPFLNAWGTKNPWSVCAFGPAEAQCMAAAIGLGGHVRVGFENNVLRFDGTTADNNSDLVSNVAQMAQRSGRGIGSVEDALRVYNAHFNRLPKQVSHPKLNT